MILLIIAITGLVSFYCFSNKEWFNKLSLRPYAIVHNREYYRAFSHALVHADWGHLIINMFVLYMFGNSCIKDFYYTFGSGSIAKFLLLYVSSILFSSIYSIYKHKNDPHYLSIGASGAVMSVVFACIFFDPWAKLWFFGVVPIPGIIFGALYLAYSLYMGKKGTDNIGHDAHFTGAIYGLLFPILLEPRLLSTFISRLFML